MSGEAKHTSDSKVSEEVWFGATRCGLVWQRRVWQCRVWYGYYIPGEIPGKDLKRMNEEIEPEVLRLPLWKACLDDILEEGVSHGQVFKAEFFEEKLRCTRDQMQYGLAISEIRRELEKIGLYLSGRGQNQSQFVVLPPECNADIMLHYQRVAMDSFRRSVILGTATKTDLLTDSEKQRHNAILERLANKVALLSRKQSQTKELTNNE